MWSCNHSVTITGSLCYMELVRCESLDWQHKLTYKLQIAFMQMTSYIEVVSAPSWSDGVRCVHAARVLCLLRCVCLVIDEPRARCCFQGMEVDCAPEDLSKCSYEERCLEVKDMRLGGWSGGQWCALRGLSHARLSQSHQRTGCGLHKRGDQRGNPILLRAHQGGVKGEWCQTCEECVHFNTDSLVFSWGWGPLGSKHLTTPWCSSVILSRVIRFTFWLFLFSTNEW